MDRLSALMAPDKAVSVNDYLAMTRNTDKRPNERLAAMFKTQNRLTPQDMTSIMSSLLFDADDLAGGASFDIDTALAGLQDPDTQAKSTAQLYNLAVNYSDPQAASQAVAALLNLSETVGFVPQMTQLLGEALSFVSAEDQAQLDARRFTWAALRRGDLSTLRGIYQALDPNEPLAGRIALASDALGNGFLLGPLGLDIETRLTGEGDTRRNARRDAFIGLGLGAQMSETTFNVFNEYKASDAINPARLAQLNSAAKSGARAHVLMMIAHDIGSREVTDLSELEIYSYVSALSDAGLAREAGELAAYDFLSRVPAQAVAE